MPREEGVVIEVLPEGAMVRIKKAGACQGCPSVSLCNMAGAGEREVLALNPIGAQSGQIVEIEVPGSLFLKASFIMYLLPVFGLIAGALMGRWIVRRFGLPFDDETGAVAGGMSCLIGIFLFIKARIRGSAYMKRYQPIIVKTK